MSTPSAKYTPYNWQKYKKNQNRDMINVFSITAAVIRHTYKVLHDMRTDAEVDTFDAALQCLIGTASP